MPVRAGGARQEGEMASGRGQRTVPGVHTVHAAHAVRSPAAQAPADGDEGARAAELSGCGWFESSRSLREGADVREHQVLDPIVNDLPLAWWIEWAGLQARARRP